ncbi:MAG: DUF1501 domain-containing protein [Rhizomicrobium sp.]|nr:DUF1501 domain-containing protein [Rhizomicrobium sp.]
MITRRNMLTMTAALSVCGGSAAFAAVPGEQRFVFVILRGALDGLAAVPPYGDADYASVRGGLAMAKTGTNPLLDLDGFFGLHPALINLKSYYDAKQLAVFHNICTPYRDRSHFDGQNVIETGGLVPNRFHDGWLNRALVAMGAKKVEALAVAQTPPLVLTGKARATSWMPDTLPEPDEAYFARVQALYAGDKELGPSLTSALMLRAQSKAAMDDPASKQKVKVDLVPLFAGAGRLLAGQGPRVAVLEASGWDTHINEGAGEGQLARRLSALDAGIDAMKQALGPAWSKTAVVIATEFGRTVKPNGSGGTDHGTGGAAFLLGGAVAGGQVHAEWMGLKPEALQDGRDLPPRSDMRALFKSVLAEHMGLSRAALNTSVFPDSGGAKAFKGLIA